MKVKPVEIADGKPYGIRYWCPGCKMNHVVCTRVQETPTPVWQFNGDMENPTLGPSIRVQWDWGEAHELRACHHYVRSGKLVFLSDCTHELAGRTVEMQEIADD